MEEGECKDLFSNDLYSIGKCVLCMASLRNKIENEEVDRVIESLSKEYNKLTKVL